MKKERHRLFCSWALGAGECDCGSPDHVHDEHCGIKPNMNNGFHLDILQALYDSEINCKLEWFWDGGIDWQLGDAVNGFCAEGSAATVNDAVKQLAEAAVKHYPDSKFAQRRK